MRLRRVRRLFRDLSGRTDHDVVRLVRRQLEAVLAGLELTLAVVRGELPPAEARARMREIEHDGDQRRAELVVLLRSTIAAPMDREDLYRVSRSADDILDHLRDLVREFDLLGVRAEPLLGPPLAAVESGVHALHEAIGHLVDRPSDVGRAALLARKASVREECQHALASLLSGDLDVDMLKRRELLLRVDAVGMRLGEAADALSDGAIKRYY